MKKLFIILAAVAMVFVVCKKENATNNPIPGSALLANKNTRNVGV